MCFCKWNFCLPTLWVSHYLCNVFKIYFFDHLLLFVIVLVEYVTLQHLFIYVSFQKIIILQELIIQLQAKNLLQVCKYLLLADVHLAFQGEFSFPPYCSSNQLLKKIQIENCISQKTSENDTKRKLYRNGI